MPAGSNDALMPRVSASEFRASKGWKRRPGHGSAAGTHERRVAADCVASATDDGSAGVAVGPRSRRDRRPSRRTIARQLMCAMRAASSVPWRARSKCARPRGARHRREHGGVAHGLPEFLGRRGLHRLSGAPAASQQAPDLAEAVIDRDRKAFEPDQRAAALVHIALREMRRARDTRKANAERLDSSASRLPGGRRGHARAASPCVRASAAP